MTIEPLSVATWPLAARLADVAAMTNVWQLLVVPEGRQAELADSMVNELTALLDRAVVHFAVGTAMAMEDAVRRDLDAPLIMTVSPDFSDEEWRTIDMARTRLERNGQTLLIMTAAAVGRLPSFAPNLWSWISDGVWTYAPEGGLGADERAQRLDSLRSHFRFDDAELVRRVASGELLIDADIGEWLVLIGQGDLLVKN